MILIFGVIVKANMAAAEHERMTDDEAMDTHYPGVEYSENILWAGWDSLLDAGVSRQVLVHGGIFFHN